MRDIAESCDGEGGKYRENEFHQRKHKTLREERFGTKSALSTQTHTNTHKHNRASWCVRVYALLIPVRARRRIPRRVGEYRSPIVGPSGYMDGMQRQAWSAQWSVCGIGQKLRDQCISQGESKNPATRKILSDRTQHTDTSRTPVKRYPRTNRVSGERDLGPSQPTVWRNHRGIPIQRFPYTL